MQSADAEAIESERIDVRMSWFSGSVSVVAGQAIAVAVSSGESRPTSTSADLAAGRCGTWREAITAFNADHHG
jgi:hypothetical protein